MDGKKREARTGGPLPVTVSGIDRFGHPFLQEARAVEITILGVLLTGITHRLTKGSRIEIQYRREKAEFIALWIGKEGTEEAGNIWVRPLEAGRSIWGFLPPPYSPESSLMPPELAKEGAPVAAIPFVRSWTGEERRRFGRIRCQARATVTLLETQQKFTGMVTDISEGGCYVEMLTPLRIESRVLVECYLNDFRFEAAGEVRISYPGLGMGIVFDALGRDMRETLMQLVDRATGRPLNDAALASRPSPLANLNGDVQRFIQALAEVLIRKGVLSAAELEEALAEAEFPRK